MSKNSKEKVCYKRYVEDQLMEKMCEIGTEKHIARLTLVLLKKSKVFGSDVEHFLCEAKKAFKKICRHLLLRDFDDYEKRVQIGEFCSLETIDVVDKNTPFNGETFDGLMHSVAKAFCVCVTETLSSIYHLKRDDVYDILKCPDALEELVEGLDMTAEIRRIKLPKLC